MMAKPIKTLKLHYPMIQLLIINIIRHALEACLLPLVNDWKLKFHEQILTRLN